MRPGISRLLLLAGLFAFVGVTYSNHFQNTFHFDDTHTIIENQYIRNLGNISRFFRDGTITSTLPANRTYRPVVFASLAVDYKLAGGVRPLWFHISTFFLFLVQIGVMFAFFRQTLDRVSPPEGNDRLS